MTTKQITTVNADEQIKQLLAELEALYYDMATKKYINE